MSFPSPIEMEQYLSVAKEAALGGGKVLRKYWGKLSHVNTKGHLDFVTEADKESEKVVIGTIRDQFPGHGMIAEESGVASGALGDFAWAIDPLDGTTNYIHGYPEVAVSIGLLFKGRPIVGVIYNPIREDLFAAMKGGGATLNGSSIAVSKVSMLEDCLLVSGFVGGRAGVTFDNTRVMGFLTTVCHGVRVSGAAALNLASVAAGSCDGCWYQGLRIWDVAAGAVLVEEAGGTVTALNGGPVSLDSGEILATNGRVHDALRQRLVALPQQR